MGVTCCQTVNNMQFQNLNKLPYLADYAQSNWPQDEDLQKQLKLSTIYQPSHPIKPLKHKVYNRWFWGTWTDGHPHGRGIFYNRLARDSIYYQGEFQGQPHGVGRVVFNGGEWEYYGQIQKGKADGKGKFINRKQYFQFQGEWKQSKPYIGKLTLFSNFSVNNSLASNYQTNQIPGNIVIELDQSKQKNESIIKYPDGKVYRGNINKGRFVPDGFGQILFPNKSKYVGEWMEGEMHGNGKFQWEDGSFYDGQYKYGKKHGTGKFRFVSGNYYQGFWNDGKQSGRGILYDKNRNQLKNGMWKQGIFQVPN